MICRLPALPLTLFAGIALWGTSARGESPAAAGEKQISILANVWSENCHANAIATKFFTGFPTDDGLIPPAVKVASIYIDQPAPDDVGHKLAQKFNVPVYDSVAGALQLGGDRLAVDGVLYIGEHGDYARSRLGVKMYPRLHILEQVFRVFDGSGRSAPVFSDKHLAYSWLDSKWIYDRAQELQAPLMAGSVLPLTWRKPLLVHPAGAKIREAVVVGHGSLDSYGFHVLEILECMLERRAGGETGVARVKCLRGADVLAALESGELSRELVEAAAAGCTSKRSATLAADQDPIAILITYRDGTKGAGLIAGRWVGEYWGYAAKVDDGVVACEFCGPPKLTGAYFSYLGLNAQQMFRTGRPQWPVERTLLTSGVLDAAVRSLHEGKPLDTPHLEAVRFQPASEPIWPNRSEPQGASLGPWPPEGFEFILRRR